VVYASRLAGALREERPAIVHAHGFKMHVLSALARPARTAVVWHVHGYLSGRAWTGRALTAVASRASAIVANSRSVAHDVRQVLGSRLPVKTIYNAVDLTRFHPRGYSLDLDALSGLRAAPGGTVRVGLVGTFGRWKGHHVFLDALSRMPPAAGVRGYVIGEPIYATSGSQFTLDELRRAAADRSLADRVGFTGFVDDVPAAMRALDIVLHASTEPEPFGMVLAEAMASGRALVASRAGGAAELFDEGVEAFGHRPGDAADLARVLTALAADPVRRARMGLAARARAEQQFDHRRLAASLVPLYRSLAAAA
jgi:glycosyltransferase involved in cell wall biosynthesis